MLFGSSGSQILAKQDTSKIRTDLIGNDGMLRAVPAETYKQYNQELISQFCVENACYFLPTIEVIDTIKGLIEGCRVIEIGSGSGSFGRALGIPLTDSFQQEDPKYIAQYAMMGQPTITYGQDVDRCDAMTAVKRYKPDTVVAAWVTHKYDPKKPEKKGNEVGVDMVKLFKRVNRIILVGNNNVHHLNPLMDVPHETIEHDGLFSRSLKHDLNRIYIWER